MSGLETLVCVLETFDFLAILASLGTFSALVIYGINKHNPAKKAQKSGSDGVNDMYAVYSEQVKDILKLKDNHIKRLNAELQQYGSVSDDTDQHEEIDLKPLAEQVGIDPSILNNPLVKKYIKKYTKGMNVEEILAIANQFKGLIGNRKPKSNDPQIVQDNPSYF